MHKIGLIINPIAGMGGRVGLKGTDGQLQKALELGAKPVAVIRAKEFIKQLINLNVDNKEINFLISEGLMGEEAVKGIWPNYQLISTKISDITTAEDTKNVVKELISLKIELLVFVGGDGTSIDILDSINDNIPILGVPSGVKMYGSVFGRTPQSAAIALLNFIENKGVIEAEIMDIDEKAYREGKLSAELKGMVLVPQSPENMQSTKHGSPSTLDEIDAQETIAEFVLDELIQEDEFVILGPGSTVRRICENLNLPKTRLGVDILRNKQIFAKDVNEEQILAIINNNKAKIIVTPLGHQGSLFGRGNQQISPKVIKMVGKENIIIVATKSKLLSFEKNEIYVDTQDDEINKLLRGYIRVVTGHGEFHVVKVK